MTSRPSTRERLLEAAIAEIESGGEAAVRVDVIAEMAAITKPSLYHFYGDREGLIVAAQIERYRRTVTFGMETMTEATRRCSSADEFRSLIRVWMSGLGAADGHERRRVRMEVLGSSVSRPTLRGLVAMEDRSAIEGLAGLIEIARERGWTTLPFSSEVAAAWWFGMMNGRYLVDDGLVSVDQVEWDELAIEAIMRLLFSVDTTA